MVFALIAHVLDSLHLLILQQMTASVSCTLHNYYMKKSIKKLKHAEKQQKQQKSSYVQHWSPHEPIRDYDALEDPHARYYFYNKCMSHHLKGLKKAIKEEPNQTEKNKLKFKIDNKLNTKLPVIKSSTPKTIIYAQEISRSEKEMKQHKRKRSLLDFSANHTSGTLIRNSRYRKDSREVLLDLSDHKPSTSADKEQIDSNKRLVLKSKVQSIDETNKVSHQKFLQFLAKKKSLLNPLQNQTTSNEETHKSQNLGYSKEQRHWKIENEKKQDMKENKKEQNIDK